MKTWFLRFGDFGVRVIAETEQHARLLVAKQFPKPVAENPWLDPEESTCKEEIAWNANNRKPKGGRQ